MGSEDKKVFSPDEFLEELFSSKLADPKKFDPEIVALVNAHLGQAGIHSKAGKNLAAAIVELADNKSQGE